MGGKKKLTLRQMEKMQSRKDVRKERRSGGSPAAEKKIFLPNHRDQKVIRELEKMKVLTPYTVASRFDLRLSVAKDFLEKLEKRGIVEYVSGSARLKIYKPSNQATPSSQT